MLKKAAYIFFTIFLITSMFSACGQKQEAQQDQPTDTIASESEEASDTTSEGTTEEITDVAAPTPYQGELKNILLMGSLNGDFSNENNQNYALTHILITLDPEERAIRFTTFPYNLKIKPVLEEGADVTQLQFLYAQYGADVVLDTFKARFGVDIDGWVIMNMDGVKSIVDELGGLEISIKDLSINEMSETVEDILGYVWPEIKETGKQLLSGIHVSGYFMDTYRDLDDDNPLLDEEMRFREKHENIIDALIAVIKISDLSGVKLNNIAVGAEDSFITNIKQNQWEEIADLALICTENEHEYLHVPEVIKIEEEGLYRYIVYDRGVDVDKVKEFVYGK